MGKEFSEPTLEVVHFGCDVIVTSDDCNCDVPGLGPIGDDDYCANPNPGTDTDLPQCLSNC